jgi:hypothetical protein
LICTAVRLFARDSSCGPGATSISRTLGPRCDSSNSISVSTPVGRCRTFDPGDTAGFLARKIVDPEGERLLAADDPEARGLGHGDAAIAFVLAAGQQQVERRVEAERFQVLRRVVDLAVADDQDTGDPLARHLRKTLAQGGEKPCALLVPAETRAAGADHAHLGVLEPVQRLGQVRERGLALLGPRYYVLARALVHHDHDHVVQTRALLLDQRGIGERRDQRGGGRGAPPDAGRPPPQGQRDGGQRDDGQGRHHGPGQQGRPADRKLAAHRVVPLLPGARIIGPGAPV